MDKETKIIIAGIALNLLKEAKEAVNKEPLPEQEKEKQLEEINKLTNDINKALE